MNIKEKTVFHICRHKELANILKEGEIFYTDRFTLEPYHKDGKNQKEISAERARIKVDPNLPIRTKSMHICLEKDLEKWKNKLITANHKWYRILNSVLQEKYFGQTVMNMMVAIMQNIGKAAIPIPKKHGLKGYFKENTKFLKQLRKKDE